MSSEVVPTPPGFAGAQTAGPEQAQREYAASLADPEAFLGALAALAGGRSE